MNNKVGARFSPVIHEIVSYYKAKGDPKALEIAAVFGWIWSYCQLRDGVCRASIVRMADEVFLSRAKFYRHLEKLVSDGFLIDTTPELMNAPHVYKDAEIYKGICVAEVEVEQVEEVPPNRSGSAFFSRKEPRTEPDYMND